MKPLESVSPPPTPASRKPPRLWPAVTLLVLFWIVYCGPAWLEIITFQRFMLWAIPPLALGLLYLIWLWTASRLPWFDRLWGFLACVGCGVAAVALSHPTMHMSALLVGLPIALTAWTVWLLLAGKSSRAVLRVGTLLVLALGWGSVTLVRISGIRGDLAADLHWRWTPTAEDKFLAASAKSTAATSGETPVLTIGPGDWPGFRGPNRDGIVAGLSIATDWQKAPPKPVWRQPIGPGWSSITVVGSRLFTQAQRGESEAVLCYDAGSGALIWSHDDPKRFEESVSGAGPRGTPTFDNGRLYTLGGAGTLNCLDAATGNARWSRDIVADSGAKLPMWGLSSSPLVTDGMVIVFAGGEEKKGLWAYHADSGAPAWTAATGKISYSSAQLATLGGTRQVLFYSDAGLVALEPASGKLLWEYRIASPGESCSLQPHLLGGASVLLASEMKTGFTRLELGQENNQWKPTLRWATRDLKPAFNDFVVYDGHAYGFDGRIFACIDLQTGKRCWKEGRYGEGQVALLADQGLLLVLSEQGAVILLRAAPGHSEELGRFQAIEGKTWAHPAVAHGRLYVRNGEEMACYQLAP